MNRSVPIKSKERYFIDIETPKVDSSSVWEQKTQESKEILTPPSPKNQRVSEKTEKLGKFLGFKCKKFSLMRIRILNQMIWSQKDTL